jgi:hypothetical protein
VTVLAVALAQVDGLAVEVGIVAGAGVAVGIAVGVDALLAAVTIIGVVVGVGLAALDHDHAGHAAGVIIGAGGLLITRVGGEVVVLFVEGVGGGLGRATGIRGEGQDVAVVVVGPRLAVVDVGAGASVGPGAGLDAVVVVVGIGIGVGDDGAVVVPGLVVPGLAVAGGMMLSFTKGVLPNLSRLLEESRPVTPLYSSSRLTIALALTRLL